MAEKKKIVGIYKITNILNDKVYIGASNDIFSRFSQHIANIKKDVFNAIPLTEINTIDDLKFELIEETTPDLLTEREAFYIDLYMSCNKIYGYNTRKKLPIARKPSEVIKVRQYIDVPKKLIEELKAEARKDNRSLSNYVVTILEKRGNEGLECSCGQKN